jgi:NifU-like protein involved in Fe-S cluster formation
MDELVKNYYKDLMQIRFRHFGALVNPSIFVDSADEHVYYCGSGNDFMQLFVNITNNAISDIKYSCFCTPVANVAVEILCTLVKNKSISDVVLLKAQDICQYLGSDDNELQKKAKAILELLNIGMKRYQEISRI